MNNNDLNRALGLVGELLAADGETLSVVIIGGAALNLLGVVSRTTRDVDVVAMTSSPGQALVAPANPLHVGIADRFDLIHFKLEAAADRPSAEANRHLEDLLALRPSDSDLDAAVAWVKEKNVGPGYHEVVNKVRDHVIAHR